MGDGYRSPEVLLVFCTRPDDETAARIAETLMMERLAACVSRVPALMSIYLWQGKVERDTETLLLITKFPSLRSCHLASQRPY